MTAATRALGSSKVRFRLAGGAQPLILLPVKVNDRGPFVSGRIADLSEAAARRIGMVATGVVEALLATFRRKKRIFGNLAHVTHKHGTRTASWGEVVRAQLVWVG